VRRARLGAFALLLVAGSAARGASAAGVSVAFAPTHQIVGAGSGFDVELRVTGAGASFNGFQAIVHFDASHLTLVPMAPVTLQQGSYMTSACSTTFHQFAATSDSVNVTDVLLCNGVSLTGPGQIYKLHFTAANTPNTTTIVHLDQVAFYDAGVRVTPVATQDDTVTIDNPVGVGDGPSGALIELRAAPNPALSGTSFRVGSPVAGPQTLLVENVAGRVVRRLDVGEHAAGERVVPWDGRDDAGRSLPSGVYLARFATPAGARAARVILLRSSR